MSAAVLGDAAAAEAEESAVCDCCGLTEDCTPAYIARVRERHGGRWVCGLCAEAVEDEIRRASPRPVGAEEAVRLHAAFRRSFRSSPGPPESDAGEHFIAAVRQLLRRGLGSPRLTRSAPSSPRKKMPGVGGSSGATLALPGGCFPALAGS